MAKFWPLSSDYADAVQMPDVCCADPELKRAKVATLPNGLPKPPCAGNFADVYQFHSQDGQKQWAVKCFTRRVTGLTERYREISRQLEAARLPFTVAFKYLEQGMLIRGEWFPVLKMDWVEGLTLRQFVEQNLQKPKMLNLLYQIWLKVEPLLRQAGVAHGDLQYGNVMLVPGSSEGKLALRLIDYDGMWVPSLATQRPDEVGHPNFQHPQRVKQNVYSPEIDRFPHLVIASALRCLARPGGERMWKAYDDGDNLLFTKQDFEAPSKSKLLLDLWKSGDGELQSWLRHILVAAKSPLSETPLLEDDVRNGTLTTLTENERRRIGREFASTSSSLVVIDETNVDQPLDAQLDATDPSWESLAELPRPTLGKRSKTQKRKRSETRSESILTELTEGFFGSVGSFVKWVWSLIVWMAVLFAPPVIVYWLASKGFRDSMTEVRATTLAGFIGVFTQIIWGYLVLRNRL